MFLGTVFLLPTVVSGGQRETRRNIGLLRSSRRFADQIDLCHRETERVNPYWCGVSGCLGGGGEGRDKREIPDLTRSDRQMWKQVNLESRVRVKATCNRTRHAFWGGERILKGSLTELFSSYGKNV